MKCRVVKSKDIITIGRFDGSYHNADANVYENVITSHSSHNLSYYCSDIFTSGRARRMYTTKEFGVPFLSNSDTSSANPFEGCSYSSKKYGFDEKAVLKGGMILTGRVGAIGQTSFVPKYWERYNAMGSDNIIRIVVKPSFKNGFIYAYLASKIGNLAFLKHSTGGVQPFITDAMVGGLPIPDFPADFQQEVDDMIQESARLREEASDALNEAVMLFEKVIGKSQVNLTANSKSIHSSAILGDFLRFDSQYQIGKSQISQYPKSIKIGEIAKKVFVGNRGKRYYVAKGIPFLSSSDMMLANPLLTPKNISIKTPSISDMIVSYKDILISRSGTVGNTIIVGNKLSGVAVSEHAMRLVVDESIIAPEYVFAYLMTKHGHDALQVLPYGSVIVTLGEEFLKDVNLPILPKEDIDKITKLVQSYIEKTDSSMEYETNAIAKVEQEIEKWNK